MGNRITSPPLNAIRNRLFVAANRPADDEMGKIRCAACSEQQRAAATALSLAWAQNPLGSQGVTVRTSSVFMSRSRSFPRLPFSRCPSPRRAGKRRVLKWDRDPRSEQFERVKKPRPSASHLEPLRSAGWQTGDRDPVHSEHHGVAATMILHVYPLGVRRLPYPVLLYSHWRIRAQVGRPKGGGGGMGCTGTQSEQVAKFRHLFQVLGWGRKKEEESVHLST